MASAKRGVDEAFAKLEEVGGNAEAEQGKAGNASSLIPVVATLRAEDHAARRRLANRSRATHLQSVGRPAAGPAPLAGRCRAAGPARRFRMPVTSIAGRRRPLRRRGSSTTTTAISSDWRRSGTVSGPSAMPSASQASSATRKRATCAWRGSGLGRAIAVRSMKARPTLSKRLCGRTTSSRRRASAIHPRSSSCIRRALPSPWQSRALRAHETSGPRQRPPFGWSGTRSPRPSASRPRRCRMT